MQKTLLVLLGALIAVVALRPVSANNSTTPTKPYTYVAGGTIRASELNSNFDTAYNELQGNIGTANLLDNAITTAKIIANAVTTAKLDSATQLRLEQTGVIKDYVGTTAPTGYVLADGKTIGDASSGATERANADTQDLYVLLYASMSDTQAPVSGGRSGNSATDFGNHKTITLPDLRGRVVAGLDNLGGTAASRLTNVAMGANFATTTNGAAGGTQSVTLTAAQMAAHTHGVTDPGHFHSYTAPSSAFGAAAGAQNVVLTNVGQNTDTKTTGITINNNTGAGNGHSVVNPVMVLSKIIKL